MYRWSCEISLCAVKSSLDRAEYLVPCTYFSIIVVGHYLKADLLKRQIDVEIHTKGLFLYARNFIDIPWVLEKMAASCGLATLCGELNHMTSYISLEACSFYAFSQFLHLFAYVTVTNSGVHGLCCYWRNAMRPPQSLHQ